MEQIVCNPMLSRSDRMYLRSIRSTNEQRVRISCRLPDSEITVICIKLSLQPCLLSAILKGKAISFRQIRSRCKQYTQFDVMTAIQPMTRGLEVLDSQCEGTVSGHALVFLKS